MYGNEIIRLFQKLNCVTPNEYRGDRNISVGCPLAPYVKEHSSDRDKNPSMSVLSIKGRKSVVKCFCCGYAASLETMMMAVNRLSGFNMRELVTWVEDIEKEKLAAMLDRAVSNVQAPIQPELPHYLNESELNRFDSVISPYLQERGIPKELCEKFEIRLDRRGKKDRIVFPYRDFSGRLLGIRTRRIGDEGYPKYQTMYGFRTMRYLYGEYHFKRTGKIHLVEGELDLLLMHTNGFTNSIALGGANFNEEKASRVLQCAEEAIIILDGDEKGRSCTDEIRRTLKGRMKIVIVELPEGKDPGNMTKEEIQERINDAQFVL